MSTFINSFLVPVTFQTLRNRKFASGFVLTFIHEVSENNQIYITTFCEDAVRRTQNLTFYLILYNGKFGLGFEGLLRQSSDCREVHVDKCVNNAGIRFTMS
jgi:hypothetical protein